MRTIQIDYKTDGDSVPGGYLSCITEEIKGESDPSLLLDLDALGLETALVVVCDGRSYVYGANWYDIV